MNLSFFVNPVWCEKYYDCTDGYPDQMLCPLNNTEVQYFDQAKQDCFDAKEVSCENPIIPPPGYCPPRGSMRIQHPGICYSYSQLITVSYHFFFK